MKKIFLTILFLIISMSAFARTGTVVSSGVTVGDPANLFPVSYCDEIQGCPQTVANVTERDLISAARRIVGMTVYTIADGKTWRLVGGITNGDFVEVVLSGGAWIAVGTDVSLATSSFNVGIGTTAPAYKLDVNGAMQAASGNFSGEGAFIEGANFSQDFDDAGPGALRMCSTNIEGGNNHCVDFDLGSVTDTFRIYSPDGITHTTLIGDLTVDAKVVAPILQAGSIGASSWSVASDIVAKYLMEENAATTAVVNATGNSAYDGVASGNTSTLTTTGKIGNGFHFSGAQTINLGSNSGLKFVHDMSACAWIKTSGTSLNIVGNRSNTTPYNGWKLFVTSSGFANFTIDGGLTITGGVTSGIAVNDNEWHFVCGTRQEGVQEIIYVDGVQSGNTVDANIYDIGTSADNTIIGDIPLVSLSNGDPFIGDMDNVSVYGTALSQTQITGLYNLGLGTDDTSGGAASNNGCLLIRDIDGAGYTELRTLNGVGSFHVDTDNLCNGI